MHEQLPIMLNKGFIKKLLSFNHMANITIKENNFTGLKAFSIRIRVIKHSFRLFRIIMNSKRNMARNLVEMIRLMKSQIILNSCGVAYNFHGSTGTQTTRMPTKDEREIQDALRELDINKMPKN